MNNASDVPFPIQLSYIKKLERGNVIDYFEIIKDDLRNMRHLSLMQLDFVQKLKNNQLYELITIFNETTKNLVHYVNHN
jgi:hypothetical protein